MPHVIAKLLAAPFMRALARILLTFTFWASGSYHLVNWSAEVEVLTSQGWGNPVLLNGAIVAVNLIGSVLIIQGSIAWLGARMLAVFTALTIVLVHHFWTMQPPQSIPTMFTAWEHITVIGGLLTYLVYDLRSRSKAD